MPAVSIIIPALNEAAALTATVAALRKAFAGLPDAELIVVDNASTDDTARVARALGAHVIAEPVRSPSGARNTGALAATGEWLVFIDADTLVPPAFARTLSHCLADASCAGGAFDTLQRPRSRFLRAYLAGWRLIGLALGMAQGAAQFCRRDAFTALGGYDVRLHMGEDVDFFWRLKRWARRQRLHVTFVRDVRVLPSPRRFDRWPVWKTLLYTNPFVAALLRRRRSVWREWHQAPPR